MVIENTKWLIGNGAKINFWLHTWLEEPIVSTLKVPTKFHNHLKIKVMDWLVGQTWSIPPNVLTAFPTLMPMIAKANINYNDNVVQIQDNLIWKGSKTGILSLKQAYVVFNKSGSLVNWDKLIWNKQVPPSHAMVFWRLIHQKIPTDEKFLIRGFLGPSICSLCRLEADTTAHVFFIAAILSTSGTGY